MLGSIRDYLKNITCNFNSFSHFNHLIFQSTLKFGAKFLVINGLLIEMRFQLTATLHKKVGATKMGPDMVAVHLAELGSVVFTRNRGNTK